MKLAITGKGGVGKTTVSALMARALRERGHQVVAIDADPDSNLAACMGYSDPGSIRPLVELKELIEERTGVKPGTTGGMFQLNPFVEDIPDKYSVLIDDVKVLVAGAVKKGGTGCYCPENAMLRALVSHLLLDEETALVLDMEAGVEHLSRGTVRCVDSLLVVVNPGSRSIETALRIKKMAGEIGLDKIIAVGNMVRSESDAEHIRKSLGDLEFAAFLPFDDEVKDAEIKGLPAYDVCESARNAICDVVEYLERNVKGTSPA